MCATSSSAFEGAAIAALRNRATTALRPGVMSRISGVIPSFSRIPAIYFAATCSFPGGFVVLIRIRSASHPCASFATFDVSPTSDGFAGIPGPVGVGACAATCKLVAATRAAAPAKTRILRFQFTNLSSSYAVARKHLSKRFASNMLHTNMQVWAPNLGFGPALRKFNRCALWQQLLLACLGFIDRESRVQNESYSLPSRTRRSGGGSGFSVNRAHCPRSGPHGPATRSAATAESGPGEDSRRIAETARSRRRHRCGRPDRHARRRRHHPAWRHYSWPQEGKLPHPR